MTGTLARPIHAGRWDVVGSLSSATFAVRNLGLKTVRGTVPIRGAWVQVDETGQPTTVHAELDLAGIDTGNSRRDRDLAKPQLLGTAQYPTLTFDCPRVDTDGDGWKLVGRLEAHGASAHVLLDVQTMASSGPDRVTVRCTTAFDRRELNVRAPRFMIGRRITVLIDAVLRMPTPARPA